MTAEFIDLLKQVEPIRLKEPLAATLGAFKDEDDILTYTLTDAIKLAGHCCPIVTGAYLACRLALERLYRDEVPIRGHVSVTVFGGPGEGVFGVISQVITLITGAASRNGFKGLGPLYSRKDLLVYRGDDEDGNALRFLFERSSGGGVMVRLMPERVPFPPDRAKELSLLMKKVIHGNADEAANERFRKLWLERIQMMLDLVAVDDWLQLEEV